jgi:hypothetical protein
MNTTRNVDFSDVQNRRKRVDEIGWGIFLIMIGTIWLVPSVPQGTWLISTGVLLLLLNAIRSRNAAEWSGFSTALGVLALAAGLSELIGIKLPLFAICLVVIGASMLFRPFVSQRA